MANEALQRRIEGDSDNSNAPPNAARGATDSCTVAARNGVKPRSAAYQAA
jgi:hypothetical protein